MKKPLFIAHRGGGSGIFENKIEMIKRTLENNLVDVIEVDVRKTKDNILVLSHNRGININGKNFWVDKVPYDEIKHLGIPTLEEILDLFKNSKKILNLDIKEKNITRNITTLLKKKNYLKKIYFDSPDLETLFELQEEIPNGEYFLSSNLEDSRDFSEKRFVRIILIFLSILLSRIAIFILKKKIKKVKLDGISLFYRFASGNFISDLKDFGFKIFIWGTDKEKDIRRLLTFNVDGVKTQNLQILPKLTQ
jgi:glycerophosphoryl diester phosphodiesterase